MTDEQPATTQDEVPVDSMPIDGTVSTNNPHPVAEDPEEHIGDEQKDPWDDEESDWRPKQTEQPADEPAKEETV